MAAKKLTPQIPGEQVTQPLPDENTTLDPVAEQPQAEDLTGDQEVQGDQVGEDNSDLKAIENEQHPNALKPANKTYRELHAHEIDPATLNRPVLSKDGWVTPEK